MTLGELSAVWRQRNARYALRTYMGVPHQVSAAEELAIRAWRLAELRSLPAEDQKVAFRTLQSWVPPSRGKLT